jgi:thioredoxin reductase (NADPH)
MKLAGEVVTVERERVRQLVADDPILSDIIMRAFVLRRAMLIRHGWGDVVVLGSKHSSDTLRLREFLTRNGHPYVYLDVETHPGIQALLERFGVGTDDVPVVVHRGQTVLRNPSNQQVAEFIGLSLDIDRRTVRDVVVIGAGPAGLAVAVYGASEGLKVLVLECEAPGGQAGSSSKIENYLGFPIGISGNELAERAFVQAAKFGAEVSVGHCAGRLERSPCSYNIAVDGATAVTTRAIVIACGARYRKPQLPELPRFENAGVYFAATPVEAQLCRGEEVVIIGGGNSAGQAAVFLSQRVRQVHMLVRDEGLRKTMSQYLIRRIEESPNITVWTQTELAALDGQRHLERVRWRDNRTGAVRERPIRHVFVMTGADPHTRWLDGCVQLDEKGFIKTGGDLNAEELGSAGWPLARAPHHLETSLPAVFAVGDVRAGSTKRVASAVGEGAACVQLIHRVLRD